jgi:acetyl-CoA C-acetyltransferase
VGRSADATQSAACETHIGADQQLIRTKKGGNRLKLNVNGSGISLGHPIGATGGRILANLLRELQRRDKRYGLETMCIGGGQGLAAVFERA